MALMSETLNFHISPMYQEAGVLHPISGLQVWLTMWNVLSLDYGSTHVKQVPSRNLEVWLRVSEELPARVSCR